MGEKLISDLVDEIVTPDDADVFVMQDVSDGQTKKLRADNARASMQAGAVLADGSVPMTGPLDLDGEAIANVGTIAAPPAVGASEGGVAALLGGESPLGVTGAPGGAVVGGGQALSDVDAASIKGATAYLLGGAATDMSAAGGTAEGGDVEIDCGDAQSFNGATQLGDVRIGRSHAGAIESGRAGTGTTWTHEGDLGVTGDVTVTGTVTSAPPAPIIESTTARALAASDHGQTIHCTHASGCAVTIPDTLPLNFTCLLIQRGAGQVEVTGAGSMVLTPAATFDDSGTVRTAEAGSPVTVVVETATVANAFGDLEAV